MLQCCILLRTVHTSYLLKLFLVGINIQHMSSLDKYDTFLATNGNKKGEDSPTNRECESCSSFFPCLFLVPLFSTMCLDQNLIIKCSNALYLGSLFGLILFVCPLQRTCLFHLNRLNWKKKKNSRLHKRQKLQNSR